MPELFDATTAWYARFAVQRLLGLTYLIAFLSAAHQFVPLLGERGLEPIGRRVDRRLMRARPSLFHLHYSDRFFQGVAWFGVALAAAATLGVIDAGPAWASMLGWFLLWAAYQSIVNVGGTFYGFGWETLLLEVGFLAIFLGPSGVQVPLTMMLLLRWVLFRVEFGAGLIKIRGDPCWRDLTCLAYHHETQPLPNPFSWFAHHLPRGFHRLETGANHLVQLGVPFALFLPQPWASAAGLAIVATQGWLMFSGNFAWLNFLTMTLAFSAFGDGAVQAVLGLPDPSLAARPLYLDVAVVAVTALVLALSIRPVRNLLSRRQLMNASFDPLHLVNTYGAFGSVTRERDEIELEGMDDSGTWRPYAFKAKPGDPARRPPQVAPYHLRLDWLMWFAALSSPAHHPWFLTLVVRLLEGDHGIRRLMGRDPFEGRPPARMRARFYRYRFTTPEERRRTGHWWSRTLRGEILPPVRLGPDGRLIQDAP
ncbi:MAG: lipase maturation factor family protein [Trueperaceae bacterium]|nr:lipase maturation factor family protein [Trueperaceae bacterium]